MFEANIGISGSDPTIYLPNDSAIADIFLDAGGYAVYPTRDSGHAYVGATDARWTFDYVTGIGNDVPADQIIDIVSVTFFGLLDFNKTIHCYFKTGGTKYYFGLQSGQNNPPVDFRYGEGGASAVHNWRFNPATGGPWTLAAITGGEFGFETSGGNFTLYGAYVSIYWGYGLTQEGGTSTTAGGTTPTASECGQSATMSAAFTNYDAKILEVKPSYGPLSGGTQIEIRGYNFVAGSTIDIGGSPATGVTFIDDQHYLATTPAHAVGFGDVVINEPLGTSLVKRNGFQFTLFTRGDDIRRMPGVNIHLGLNSGANTCSFVVDGDSNPPKVGEKIQIIDEFAEPRRLLFAGNVQSVEQVYEGLNTQLAWNVSAVDFTWLLNRRRPFGEYHNISASDIAKDLINRYAPGFTTNFVQTNLARVSIAFDGSWDLQTCLSVLARMIGGGHWYVDFNQDLHFFHIVPPDVNMPTAPSTTVATPGTPTGLLRVGPGSAPTVAQGAAFGSGFSFSPGFFLFQVTFVYDNGTESAYGPATCVALDGQHKIAFSDLPIGPAIGTLTVIKRRIYYKFNGIYGGSTRVAFCQIDDNTTTAFTTVGFAPQTGEIANISSTIFNVVPPVEAYVAPPAYLETSVPNPSATTTPGILCQPEYRPAGQTQTIIWSIGLWRFRVRNIYQDLTESQMGPASVPFQSDAVNAISLDNIPVGTAINGVPVIARRILAAFGTNPSDADYTSWWIVPNNTAMTAVVYPTTANQQAGAGASGAIPPTPDRNPVWPNDDGPFLEGFDPPDDVTDDSPYLLRNPQVTSQVDLSQVRNRIFIRGAGSSTTDTVGSTSTTIPVADTSYYSTNGGQVFVEGQVLSYTGVSTAEGPGNLILNGTVGEEINSGAPVSLYLMVEDKASQAEMGLIELDFNGRPTDGVHEYVIIDGSLETPYQMFTRGMAELELYSRTITTVRYSTRDPKTRPGVMVHISLTNPPISGDFLIQEVTIDQIHNEADDLLEPRYNVTTSSNKFDLGDLFFQWSTRTSNPYSGGGGGAGPSPSPSGTPEAAAPDEGFAGTPANPTATNMWTGVSPATLTKVDQVWTSAFTTAITVVTDNGYWLRMQSTSTGEGGDTTQANIPNVAMFQPSLGFKYNIYVRFPSSQENTIAGKFNLFVGLYVPANGIMNYDGPANGDTRSVNNTRKFIGFRVDGRGFAGLIANGTNCLEYSPGFHLAQVDSPYLLQIRVISAASIATPDFGAFYKQNFPGGVIELSAATINETTNNYTLRIATPTALLGESLMGFACGYNAEQPSPNTTKTFDINTAYGSFGPN